MQDEFKLNLISEINFILGLCKEMVLFSEYQGFIFLIRSFQR